MQATPLVSVIVCAYNAEAFISETLQSLIAQTYPHMEIVVVDDGSSDRTAAIVQSMAKPIIYHYQKNAGISAARNTGIRLCSGDLICFFDADDLMPPDRIAVQVDFMHRYPDVGVVFSDYRNFSGHGEAEQTHFETCPQLQAQVKGQSEVILTNVCAILANENFGIAGTPMMRRILLSQVQGFDTHLRSCEDFHFYFRLARFSRVGVINRVGMLRRMHANNLSRNWRQMLTSGVQCYSMLRDNESDHHVKQLLNAQVAVNWFSLARNEANHNEYVAAFKHYIATIRTEPSLRTFIQALHGIVRTLALGMRVHRPDEDCSLER